MHKKKKRSAVKAKKRKMLEKREANQHKVAEVRKNE
jgi:hypothetical protein